MWQEQTISKDIGEASTRCSPHKGVHKDSGDSETGVTKRTSRVNQRKDCSLSRSHGNLTEMKSVSFLVQKPMMDLLSPRLAAKDRAKSSSLPCLGKGCARNLPPASEHFEMVASKMFDRAPSVMVQNGRKEVKNQLEAKLPRKGNARERTKNTNPSQDWLRRKVLLRPYSWSGSKSAPNSPPQVKKASNLTFSSCHSRRFTAAGQVDPNRRGSCPTESSCASPPAAPFLRREVVDRMAHGTQVLIDEPRRFQPSFADVAGGPGGVNTKSLLLPSLADFNLTARRLVRPMEKTADEFGTCEQFQSSLGYFPAVRADMPKYRLTYFDLRARAEPIRIVFAYAGVEYEDVRISYANRAEVWPPIKKSGKFPFEQIPILEVDGVTLSHSTNILRFVAKEHGLAPSDNLHQALADNVTDEVHDLEDQFVQIQVFEREPQHKERRFKHYMENTLPVCTGLLEKVLANNKGGSVYFVGEKLTYADIKFFNFYNAYFNGGFEAPKELKDFPLLSGLYERVAQDPKIRPWLEKRPQTPL